MDIKLAWNKQEITDIYIKHKYLYKKYPAKAKLLQKEFDKFSGLSAMDIEHLLRYMALNDKKSEFVYTLNRKRTYNDCVIVNEEDDKTRLQLLQNNYDKLKCKFQDLYNKYKVMHNNFVNLKKQYDIHTSIEHNLDVIITNVLNDQLDKTLYYKLIKSVLDKIRIDKRGHIKFETGTHVIEGIICSVFNTTKGSLPKDRGVLPHVKNLNDFISIKCKGKEDLEKEFIMHVIHSNEWKRMIKDSMNVCDSLNKKQTIMQYIRSNGSIRSFCKNNTERNKLFGHQTTVSESVIRQAIRDEQLETELYRVCKLEISEAESKYNYGCKYKNIYTFGCDPTEQICVSFAKELETTGVTLRTVFGLPTLIVNMGSDKWADGVMYSALLCTKLRKNNSPKRRRPVAFAEAPAIESTYNIEKLLQPYITDLMLLKDNACILRIGNNCAVVTCSWDQKNQMDDWWRHKSRVGLVEFPKTMMEAEELRRKSHWNLVNHAIDKIYIMEMHITNSITLPINTYPEIFICFESSTNIDMVYVYKQGQRVSPDKVEYSRIGSGKFWNLTFDIEKSEIIIGIGNKCFSFNEDAALIYMAIHDGGDLSGFDSRYNLGTHSNTHFCIYCQTDDKTNVFDDGTSYRTRENINVNADLFRQACSQSTTKPSPLQVSRGVAGRPVDPYPGASRITPSLLHYDMGIMTKLLNIHNQQIQLHGHSNPNLMYLHQQALDQYKIYTNRYYKSLEGKQAKLYRQNFSIIASVLTPSPIYHHMSSMVSYFNQLMSIIGKSEPYVEESQCKEAEKALKELDKAWTRTRNLFNISLTLGTKYHYLRHCIDYMRIWSLPIGYISEQSIENFHKTCSMVIRRYRNQRGLLRVKYAMQQLIFITSPLYQS